MILSARTVFCTSISAVSETVPDCAFSRIVPVPSLSDVFKTPAEVMYACGNSSPFSTVQRTFGSAFSGKTEALSLTDFPRYTDFGTVTETDSVSVYAILSVQANTFPATPSPVTPIALNFSVLPPVKPEADSAVRGSSYSLPVLIFPPETDGVLPFNVYTNWLLYSDPSCSFSTTELPYGTVTVTFIGTSVPSTSRTGLDFSLSNSFAAFTIPSPIPDTEEEAA